MIDLYTLKVGDTVVVRDVSVLQRRSSPLVVSVILRGFGDDFHIEFDGITGWTYYKRDGRCPVCAGADILSIVENT